MMSKLPLGGWTGWTEVYEMRGKEGSERAKAFQEEGLHLQSWFVKDLHIF